MNKRIANDGMVGRLKQMVIYAGLTIVISGLMAVIGVTNAHADFGISAWTGLIGDRDGSTFNQAGGHPYSITTTMEYPSIQPPADPDGQVKDALVDLPPGLLGNPTAVPSQCTYAEFTAPTLLEPQCPIASQVGTLKAASFLYPVNLWNMQPPAGYPAMFGAKILGVSALLLPTVRSNGDYGLTIGSIDISQTLPLDKITVTFWGVPADPIHDAERGLSAFGKQCAQEAFFGTPCHNQAGYPETAFLTLPTNCAMGNVPWRLAADEWANPGVFHTAAFDKDTNGNALGVTGCDKVPFNPEISAQATTDQAGSPSGLDVDVTMPDTGMRNPDGIAQSYLKKAVVRLPEGMSVNPSAGEGLGACSPADFAREKLDTETGQGCPNSSKIGTVKVVTPALKESLDGSLFIAQQDDPATSTPGAENPFNSLLALYVVVRSQERGVIIKLSGEVKPDDRTGQLVTTFDGNPQLPFTSFHLHFREGGRAPLVSPQSCGTYTTQADFVPWSASDPNSPRPDEIVHTTSQFRVTRGVGGGSCPSGVTPAFQPSLVAGTINNAAGAYSPFNVRLTRNDGEQEFTNFSIKLPPGVSGKLAGVPFCPDSAIAAAKSKTGTEELANPSCPKASEVGRTLVGAGVGSVLTYVPGKVYLAGPYNGSALSVAAITAAKVGPFDLGTVVIREALKVNPDTAEVFIDPTGSDPIPHIIRGIPVHARDIRVYVDRPEFVLNPTSCRRTSTASTVLGSGLDFASSSDDNPITVTSPFQAADCANLGFKPKLALSLIGGTKRGDNPRFKAVLTARKGDANIGLSQVTLPHSEFLDNEHIKTICTRAQFKEGTVPGEKCPAASIYGYAKAETPLLDEPLAGPVFLRSSSHNLPDLLVALHSGKINVNLAGRIDSVQGGRIRNTFEAVPDAPVTRFTLTMQGGKKGLLVNSVNLCKHKNRAIVAFTGQNGKQSNSNPIVKPQCGKKSRGKGKKHRAG